jgi:isoamylase
LRGLANETYYILGEDRATHADYTGTGNTLNANESIVRLDWSGLERHADVRRFAQHLIAFRLARTLPMEGLDITLNELLAQNPIEWHGVQLGEPDWGDTSHSLAATLHCEKERLLLHLMVNAYWEPLAFALPALAPDHDGWRCCVDTFRVAPDDICPWAQAQAVHGGAFTVQPRSLAVLVAHAGPEMKAEEGCPR